MMLRKFTGLFLLYFAVGSNSLTSPAVSTRRDETVTATVVAHSVEYAPACHDVCYGSLIARLDQPETPAIYIRVLVGYRPGESRFSLINRKRKLRLRLSRIQFPDPSP